MIFPFLNGVFSFRLAPVTWLLFGLNLYVFFATFSETERAQNFLEKSLDDEVYSRTQGYLFAKFIEKHQSRYPANLQMMAAQTIEDHDLDRRRILSSLAYRDTFFTEQIMEEKLTGDPIALGYWQKKFEQVKSVQENHPVYNMGLTKNENTFVRWISYQFSHSGTAHLIGNMIFFLIFSSALEQIIGGFGVLAVYLLSGIFGAFLFYLISDASAIPLIGASAAVSGFMALFAILFWRRAVRFLFFLFIPVRGYAGFVFLPAWVILILWGLQDLAGFMATPGEYGGVAYSAHLGGEICGVLFGVLIICIRKIQGLEVLPEKVPVDIKPAMTRYT